MVPLKPSADALRAIFVMKYGDPTSCGWGPGMRWRFDYFNPDDWYEALLLGIVRKETRWLDVGCGRELFPSNQPLGRELSKRCALLAGVDPDATLDENPYVHERAKALFDDWDGGHRFDLITLRMVAEHVVDPSKLMASIRRAAAPGARVVVYTVNKFSPVPLFTSLVPFGLRHKIKHVLWRTQQKDTFPTAFQMNTRATLQGLFAGQGFREVAFEKLDDCRSFSRFRFGQWCELSFRRLLRCVGLRYPETCLLGVYELENGA